MESAELNCQFWKLHDLPIMDNTRLSNFGNYMACQLWKVQNLPILVITKLTTFGNNKTCQFWIQSKLPVLEAKNENSIPQVKI